MRQFSLQNALVIANVNGLTASSARAEGHTDNASIWKQLFLPSFVNIPVVNYGFSPVLLKTAPM